jgi:hypothetical protein
MAAPKPAYSRRAAARETSRQRDLMGETLDAFHRRETAEPPTLAEVYAENHRNRERCPATPDLLAWQPPPGKRRARPRSA